MPRYSFTCCHILYLLDTQKKPLLMSKQVESNILQVLHSDGGDIPDSIVSLS
jgi:hypothetical protein